MAIFLSRAFNLTKEANVAFPDVTSEQAAYVHIKRILAAGLTAGFPDGTYRPNNLVKRSDFSALMSRALDPRFKTRQRTREIPCFSGETVIVEGKDYLDGNRKYEMELVDKITDGATAWQMIKEANMFNDPPPAGQKYILVKFRFKALEMESETLEAYSVYFEAVSKDGVVYESAIVVQPEPDLWADLYEGGEYEGWAAFLINENDQPLIVWQREWDDESWFTLE